MSEALKMVRLYMIAVTKAAMNHDHGRISAEDDQAVRGAEKALLSHITAAERRGAERALDEGARRNLDAMGIEPWKAACLAALFPEGGR